MYIHTHTHIYPKLEKRSFGRGRRGGARPCVRASTLSLSLSRSVTRYTTWRRRRWRLSLARAGEGARGELSTWCQKYRAASTVRAQRALAYLVPHHQHSLPLAPSPAKSRERLLKRTAPPRPRAPPRFWGSCGCAPLPGADSVSLARSLPLVVVARSLSLPLAQLGWGRCSSTKGDEREREQRGEGRLPGGQWRGGLRGQTLESNPEGETHTSSLSETPLLIESPSVCVSINHIIYIPCVTLFLIRTHFLNDRFLFFFSYIYLPFAGFFATKNVPRAQRSLWYRASLRLLVSSRRLYAKFSEHKWFYSCLISEVRILYIYKCGAALCSRVGFQRSGMASRVRAPPRAAPAWYTFRASGTRTRGARVCS